MIVTRSLKNNSTQSLNPLNNLTISEVLALPPPSSVL
jgi:hypothetical protein